MNWWQRNGNTVITLVGIAGFIGTVITTAKAAPKIDRKLKSRRKKKIQKTELVPGVCSSEIVDLTPMENAMSVAKAMFPECITPLIFGAVTIGSMIGCNKQNVYRQTAVASTYTIMKRLYDENREKVKAVIDEINPLDTDNPTMFDNVEESMHGDPKDRNDIFYLECSGRRFRGNLEQVENDLAIASEEMHDVGNITFNEIYICLGLAESKMGAYEGFSRSERMDDIKELSINEQGPLYWQIRKVTSAEGINAEDAKKLQDSGQFIYMISFDNYPEDISWFRELEP